MSDTPKPPQPYQTCAMTTLDMCFLYSALLAWMFL